MPNRWLCCAIYCRTNDGTRGKAALSKRREKSEVRKTKPRVAQRQ
jgi:hypothetical protein